MWRFTRLVGRWPADAERLPTLGMPPELMPRRVAELGRASMPLVKVLPT